MKIPKDWTFKDDSVANGFNKHVAEQLPWYNMAQSMAAHLGRSYMPEGGILVDLGCSTGNLTRRLAKTLEARRCSALSVDTSQEMISLFDGYGEAICADATNENIFESADVIYLFLTMMFIPTSKRESLITSLKGKLNSGGVIILVDKSEPMSGYLGSSISRMTISNKLEAGVKPKEIIEKELSLCGAQRPVNDETMKKHGFDLWLKIGDFCGWVYSKK